ncbi:hypothetical protein H4R33_004182 [Dimargaris cristalligena]|nr:hypothetical protein H4R33_004182 [Dimargaris cristalligena]
MPNHRVSRNLGWAILMGLILGLSIQKATAAPGLSMSSLNHDDFDMEYDLPMEEFGYWDNLPRELEQNIIKLSSPFQRYQLSGTSQEFQARVLNAEYELLNENRKALLTDSDPRKDGGLSQLEAHTAFQSWAQLVSQPLAAFLFLVAAESLIEGTEQMERSAKTSHHYITRLVIFNYWQYINPQQLPASVRAARYPLLAQVDIQNNGTELMELLNALTDPARVSQTDSGGWTSAQREQIQEILSFIEVDSSTPLFSDTLVNTSDWIFTLFGDLIQLIMIRLSTTNRVEDFRNFMVGLQSWSQYVGLNDDAGNEVYRHLNQFAIILSAVAQEPQQLADRTKVLIDLTDPETNTENIHAAQCNLVRFMEKVKLPKGAAFLAMQWECPPPVERRWGYTTGLNGRSRYRDFVNMDDYKSLIPNWALLTDDNQVDLLTLMSGFEPEERALVFDMSSQMGHKLNLDSFVEDFEGEDTQKLRQALDNNNENSVCIYDQLNPSSPKWWSRFF